MAEETCEASPAAAQQTAGTVLRAFTRLGLTSFGGPVAHIGYFREEFVARRKWFDEQSYADLVALCQFLPGPTSSQVGIGIGLTKAGIPGAIAAWFAFTLPSALIMLIFGLGVVQFGDAVSQGWIHGLKVAAVAVVAQAVWGMARTLCPDAPRATIAILAAVYLLVLPSIYGQFLVILAGGIAGAYFLPASIDDDSVKLGARVGKGVALSALSLFFVLLIGLPVSVAFYPDQMLAMIDSFYRSGSLVFGGGHVVLPL
ncbi:MAG: chromate efflux transporter, partial [Proteobacteria bacterium]|nr:chromate efflux transporter [Pseudomonadota bacterium]